MRKAIGFALAVPALMLGLVLQALLPGGTARAAPLVAQMTPEYPYMNGHLILDQGSIFAMYRGQKIEFASAAAFTGLGFDWTNLYGADIDYMSSAGTSISTAKEHHPWGSWVLGGKTVYFVHESGLIPVTTWDIFLNNGGEGRLVVPMNWYDWQLPQQKFLAYSDTRLQDKTSADHTITTSPGQDFSIDLKSNPSTGYSWDVSYDSYFVTLTGRTYQSSSDLVGAGGTEKFEFQALNLGQTTITFTYRRSWESGIAQQEIYTIIIQ